MARPSNRYARAQARARVRKPKRRSSSLVWNVAIAVIVVAGVAAIVVSRTGSADTAPVIGDHWHAQFSVFVCGQEQAPAPDSLGGVHSHAGDPFIHIHPNSSAEAGNRATVGKFLESGNWDLDEDSFDLWFGSQRNGDPCPDGQPGVLRWAVNGEERSGNPADYKPENLDEIVISFAPEDQELPAAPSATPQGD